MRRSWLFPVVALALVGAGGAAEDRFDTVVIDAGHGGEDEGARSRNGLHEKDLVLDVAQRLAGRLRSQGLRVVMTREDDRFVSLEERTSLANDARGDLFVSIHANWARTQQARGIETFFASLEATDEAAGELAARENRAFSGAGEGGSESDDPLLAILGDLIATEHLADSSEFAGLAQSAFVAHEEQDSRGVKQAPFVVLMGVQMPAALVEIGFLSNPDDERAMRTKAWKERISNSLGEAVVAFGRRYDARRGVEEQQPRLQEDP